MTGPSRLYSTLVLLADELLAATALKMGPAEAHRECGQQLPSFPQFVEMYDRNYIETSDEYRRREELYMESLRQIEQHNCAPAGPWTAGVNHLADWTSEELAGLRGFKPARRTQSVSPGSHWASLGRAAMVPAFQARRREGLPESADWGHLSAIKEPRDQGGCGSCWAFAAETVMRAHAEVKQGRPTRFATDQIVQCAPNPNECGGKGGCQGSTPELAYEYVLLAGVSTLENYSGKPTAPCPVPLRVPDNAATKAMFTAEGAEIHMLSGGVSAQMIGMTGWTKFPENREEPLVRALVEHGPISVAVATGFQWWMYHSGIMSHDGCSADNVVDHAVVLYGFGAEGTKKYWRIKNSWSASWGENGMLRLERLDDEEGHCGWDDKPEVGLGCKGGPAKVWVCGSCAILYDTVMPHFQSLAQ